MARKCSGARCICSGSRHFTYGSSRGYENLMKEPSKANYKPQMSSNARVFTRSVVPAKG